MLLTAQWKSDDGFTEYSLTCKLTNKDVGGDQIKDFAAKVGAAIDATADEDGL